jgi:hypothetical protein
MWGALPDGLRDSVFPMSAAINPSLWYGRLFRYKAGEPESGRVLTAVAHCWITAHLETISSELGGEPTLMTIVPSKREGVTFRVQPLRRAIADLPDPPAPLVQLLEMVPGAAVPRNTYRPEAFEAVRDVRRHRVLLIEDSWVSGATPLSAAGAILQAGAAAVAVVPIARVVDREFWIKPHPGHPYVEALARPYDPNVWPY